jgi:ankyrin repeat protein
MIRIGHALGVAIVLLVPLTCDAQPLELSRVREAATRGYAAIQVAQKTSRSSQTCAGTCHLQYYGAFAYRAMRAHGLALDEAVARADGERAFRRTGTSLTAAVEGNSLGEIAMNEAFALVSAHELDLPRTLVTAAVARAVAFKQNPEGDWPALRERPPSNYSSFTFTALGLRALQLYGHPRQRVDLDRRIARARAWLQSHEPRETEERTYQLLGLGWAGAAPDQLAPLVRALTATQRPDGGWNSLDGRDSDAYSTAQALVALHEAGGVATTDSVWRRGLEFLLRTQAKDGTWHVKTRLPPWVSPPYFESGYPYGRDQFISVAGAAWSVRALALALGPAAPASAPPLPLAGLQPDAIEPWVETAMFGTAAELQKLLDGGFNANQATKTEALTALMLAMPDLDKVKLLVDRGADVNVQSRSRYTALLIGAQYRDATPALRFLLARGARVAQPAGDRRPVADAYPTFVAAQTGNAEILPDLHRAGDSLEASAMMFGAAPVQPLLVATYYNYIEVARTLISLGAKVDPPDDRYDSPLASTVFAHHVELARLLIKAGANVNRVDDKGMTPLMYAAIADFGDSAMVDLLLASGARTGVRDKSGLTAADHARQYGHLQLVGRLQ